MKNKFVQVSFYLFLFLSGFCPQSIYAAAAPDYTIHQEYTSTRALGMGNAFIAVADDHSAVFYNPAGLFFRKDGQVRMLLRAGADAEYPDFVDELDAAGEDATAVNNVIANHYGDHLYSRVPTLGGIWARPKWGLAILPVDLSIDLVPHMALGPSIYVNAYLDTTIAFARAHKIKVKSGTLAVGWTLKALHRAFYSDIVMATQIIQDQDVVDMTKSAEGMTLDFDLGFMYKFSDKRKLYMPTLAFVTRNVVDYGFPVNFEIFNDNPKEPPKLQRRFDVGSKFDLPTFWVFDPKLAIDIRDMGHDNWTWKKGFHAGAEMYWKMYNWWKGHWSVGLNQGYMSAGFGARLAIFQIDLATWGEEVGTSDAPKESRRYIAEMSLDF